MRRRRLAHARNEGLEEWWTAVQPRAAKDLLFTLATI